jgi:hypothetical protein
MKKKSMKSSLSELSWVHKHPQVEGKFPCHGEGIEDNGPHTR